MPLPLGILLAIDLPHSAQHHKWFLSMRNLLVDGHNGKRPSWLRLSSPGEDASCASLAKQDLWSLEASKHGCGGKFSCMLFFLLTALKNTCSEWSLKRRNKFTIVLLQQPGSVPTKTIVTFYCLFDNAREGPRCFKIWIRQARLLPAAVCKCDMVVGMTTEQGNSLGRRNQV